MKSLAVSILFIIAAVLFSFFTYRLLLFEVVLPGNDVVPIAIPSVIIMANLSSGNAPLNVQFKSLPRYFDEDCTYLWEFGDETTSNEQHPRHLYSTAGDYTCTLTVQDKASQSSDKLSIAVHENNPPIVKIVVDKASGNRPMIVHFDAAGFDIDGIIESYDWEIIYPPFFSKQKVVTRQKKNFSERFFQKGFYEVRLIVKDNFGNTATDYIKIQVLGHKLELLLQTGMYYRAILGPFFQKFKKSMDKGTFSNFGVFGKRILTTLSASESESGASRDAFIKRMQSFTTFLERSV